AFRRSAARAGRPPALQCMPGRPPQRQPQGGWPSLGSVVSKVQGPTPPAVPPFVGLSPPMITMPWADPGQPGFLGLSHAPFKPNADGLADMTLKGVTLDRLGDRKALLGSFDGLRRGLDVSGAPERPH